MKEAVAMKELCDEADICVYEPLNLTEEGLQEAMLIPVMDPQKLMELDGSDTEKAEPEDSDDEMSRDEIIR